MINQWNKLKLVNGCMHLTVNPLSFYTLAYKPGLETTKLMPLFISSLILTLPFWTLDTYPNKPHQLIFELWLGRANQLFVEQNQKLWYPGFEG